MATKAFKKGNYLAEWRKYAGMSQEELGAALGHSDVTISRWETGARRMDTDDLAKVASVISRKIQFPVDSGDILKHPDSQPLDAMMRGAPDSLKQQALAIIRAIKESGGNR